MSHRKVVGMSLESEHLRALDEVCEQTGEKRSPAATRIFLEGLSRQTGRAIRRAAADVRQARAAAVQAKQRISRAIYREVEAIERGEPGETLEWEDAGQDETRPNPEGEEK